ARRGRRGPGPGPAGAGGCPKPSPPAPPTTPPPPPPARRTRAIRPTRHPSSSTASSTSAPLSTTTPWPRIVLITAPPCTTAPLETSELSACPGRPAASATTLAGPYGPPPRRTGHVRP